MANKKNTKKKKNGAKNKSSNVKAKVIEEIEEIVPENEEVEEKNSETLEEIKKEKQSEDKKKTVERAKRDLVYADSGDNEMGKLFKIVLIVTAILIVFYGVTVVVTKSANSAKKKNEVKEELAIQYNKIIIGSMLNKDGEYYVLIEQKDDEHLTEYQNGLQMAQVNDHKTYEADLSDSFNKSYLSDKSNYDSDLTKFKVTGTSLVQINDHNISSVYDNYDSIKAKLEELK
ncbi:MAG: hypothetical protein IKJ43_02620 [Bacilli bacterium]|nr:hypothetical protein [Bacilli bacterium]